MLFVFLSMFLPWRESVRERQRETQRDREKERDRERKERVSRKYDGVLLGK